VVLLVVRVLLLLAVLVRVHSNQHQQLQQSLLDLFQLVLPPPLLLVDISHPITKNHILQVVLSLPSRLLSPLLLSLHILLSLPLLLSLHLNQHNLQPSLSQLLNQLLSLLLSLLLNQFNLLLSQWLNPWLSLLPSPLLNLWPSLWLSLLLHSPLPLEQKELPLPLLLPDRWISNRCIR